jgi:hypothetical protein
VLTGRRALLGKSSTLAPHGNDLVINTLFQKFDEVKSEIAIDKIENWLERR